jgi:predicted amidohydrolase YtcJ
VQHASGKAWFLNSAALERLGVLDQSHGVAAYTASPVPEGLERDGSGIPTGRLFRSDDWLRSRLSAALAPDLAALSQDLVRLGITGVTDASADNDNAQADALGRARDAGALVQRLRLMGGPDLSRDRLPDQIELGERKLLLDDDALPDMDVLLDAIRAARESGRGTAWHCVSRAELLYALYALDAAGPGRSRDRIEHAGVVPPECLPLLAQRSLVVVTQPLFIAARGDRYLEQADPDDIPCLYRLQSLRRAGVALGLSSDAPYAAPDPWAGMRAAVERRTAGGHVVGIEEALTPEQALAGYLSPLASPGGGLRSVATARGDLCLLDRPWSAARGDLHAGLVRAVIIAGRLHYLRDR